MATTKTFVPPYGPVGVARVLQDVEIAEPPSPTLFKHEFALTDRVALVTGGNRGLGLEVSLAFIEAGARVVYCVDIDPTPSSEWTKVRDYAVRMVGKAGEGRLEYIHGDVRDQDGIWGIGKQIGDKEGRLDVCFAGAGITGESCNCLHIRADAFRKVMDVNLNGVLFTAQAAGQQMARFGKGGSIILASSFLGHQTVRELEVLPYMVGKSALLQLARNFAVELASKNIRVNSVSPGYLRTRMTELPIKEIPGFGGDGNPMGRIGEPHELRGLVTWLASDASSYCTGTDVYLDAGHHAW
ncbi:sorbose reductase sou1 [Trametes meyenii]|nr:sorbose reductase sou1 [Trametes meyenii]